MTYSAICAKCRAVLTEQVKLSGHHRKYYSGTQVNFRKRLKIFFEWLKMNAKRLLVEMSPGPRTAYRLHEYIFSNLKRTMSIHFCRFMVWGVTLVLTASICMLTFISFDRYLKITKPPQHKSRMTSA